MGRKKLTPVQILERYKIKPNATVGDFNNALNRTGLVAFFVNSNVTWSK